MDLYPTRPQCRLVVQARSARAPAAASDATTFAAFLSRLPRDEELIGGKEELLTIGFMQDPPCSEQGPEIALNPRKNKTNTKKLA
ncbi:hypothetical protein BN874_1620011 [Candidatus Contendobacter odensis Run_B_J11]|uniref:Uncharacterized protein n=1 Tax=Candidatus Contendobacter odensis Run_B_J11 TaxID=1400861 RepID=A0A7U7J2N7_9GAMM|nr:hypothetical protein BN874_1620011 [Candidatus Contendobacter odensis Run_B_J11]